MARTSAVREVYHVHPFYLLMATLMAGMGLAMFGAGLVQFFQEKNLEWYFLPISLSGIAFWLWAWFAVLTLRLVIDRDYVECTNLFSRHWRRKVPWQEVTGLNLDNDGNRQPGQSVFGRTAYLYRSQGLAASVPTSLLWNRKKAEAGLKKRVGMYRTFDRETRYY